MVALHQLGVDDGALDEGDVVVDELAVAAGQVVDHDDVEADLLERPHHVRADVAGASGHHPRHATFLQVHASIARLPGYGSDEE